MSTILLTTLNARYIHCAFGLRYLYANMGELQNETELLEFTITQRPIDIAEKLLETQAKIIGFGVYIWNVQETTQVAAILKQVAPDIKIVLGGPEVSFEHDQQPIVQQADYVICGAADLGFAKLCRQILNGPQPLMKIHPADSNKLNEIKLPYQYYQDEDIRNRVIYVEASRGCPFKCEFCISALDKTATPFDLTQFLNEMATLYQRGVRHFKFVDRTFNLKIDSSIRIMEFFLARMNPDDPLFLHFELIPDHLPERLKEVITLFPEGTLQFEIGVQSFNPEVQKLISRKQDEEKTCHNLRWLRQQSHAHLHTDLILGLPGEDLASIATGFDKLVELNPHEIQVGILKRLRGTPIIRHTDNHHMRYTPHAPYNVLATDKLNFADMQRLSRFARYWDMIANSGRFSHTLPLILGDQPFNNFMSISNWLFSKTQQTHKIALVRLFDLLHQAISDELMIDSNTMQTCLLQDFACSGIKGRAPFLNSPNHMPHHHDNEMVTTPTRQQRHRKK